MNVWNKLVTALRGAAHEAGETVTDSQALRILDQEIRDADNDLNRSKEALAEMEEAARQLGGNAVIGVDIDYEVLGQNGSMLMVSASGTAVRV